MTYCVKEEICFLTELVCFYGTVFKKESPIMTCNKPKLVA